MNWGSIGNNTFLAIPCNTEGNTEAAIEPSTPAVHDTIAIKQHDFKVTVSIT